MTVFETRTGHAIAVDALRDVDLSVMARSVGMELDAFLDDLERWTTGLGVPYGIGAPRTYRCPVCSAERRSTTRDELDPRWGGFYCDDAHPPTMLTMMEPSAP